MCNGECDFSCIYPCAKGLKELEEIKNKKGNMDSGKQ